MPRAHPPHRLFFALQPDAAARDEVGRLRAGLEARHGPLSGATPDARLHISLHSLGGHAEIPWPLLERAGAAAATLAMRPFRVSLNRLARWKSGGDRRPLVLWGDEGAIGIERLQAALHDAMALARLAPPRPRPFWPHLTLAWGDEPVEDQAVLPVSWTVRSFVLLDGRPGAQRHAVLGRWTLNEAVRPALPPARPGERPDPRRSAAR